MPFAVAECDPREISFFHHDRAFRRYDSSHAPTRSVDPGLGVYEDINKETGTEAWLTVEEAERLHYLLGSAIRRHTGYGRVA